MTDHNGGTPSSLGGTVGGKLARLVSDATVATRAKMAPHTARIAQGVFTEATNHVSDEVRGVMGPLFRRIADDPETPEEFRALFRSLGTQRGQAWAWIGGTATGAAMAGGLINLLTNALNPVILPMIASAPHGILSAGEAAAIAARGLARGFSPSSDAASGGIDNDRFAALTALQTALPTVAELLDMLNRGHADSDDVRAILRRYGYRREDIERMLLLRTPVLSPEVLAQMWNRSIVDTNTGQREAARSGMPARDFDRLTELFGEPLPPQELLTAQRRGIIDAARTRRGWVQGPFRNEWFDVAQAMQYAPMSSVDAADAALQGHLGRDAARRIAMENGLRGDDFEIMLDSAGLPPGVELASEALNRGLLTPAEFRSAFLESRLKNKYVELYFRLRYRIIPQETVRRLYRLGTYTREQALERLGWAGFAPEDAEALIASEEGEDLAQTRELTKTEILGLLSDRAVDEATARTWLIDLGYAESNVDWLITLAELRRSRRYTDAVLARVRAGYVGFRMEESEASSLMDSLRIPPEQRDELLSIWGLERLAVTRGLTPAQIVAARKKRLLTADDAMAKMGQQGYSEQDAAILLGIAEPVE